MDKEIEKQQERVTLLYTAWEMGPTEQRWYLYQQAVTKLLALRDAKQPTA